MNYKKIAVLQVTRFIAIILSAVFALILASAAVLLLPSVNEWLFGKILDTVPGLKIERLSGSVFDELTINGIDYQSDSFKIHVAQLESQLVLPALLKGTLRFQTFVINDLRYEQTDSDDQDEAIEVALPLPLRLEFERIVINHADYHDGAENYQIQQLSAALNWSGNQINLTQAYIDFLGFHIDAAGDIRLMEQLPFHLAAGIDGDDDQLGLIKTQWQLTGDTQKIDIQMQASAPATVQASGSLLLEKQQPEWLFEGSWKDIQWPLQGKADFSSSQGRFVSKGAVDDYHIDLSGKLKAVDIADATMRLSARGNSEQLHIVRCDLNALGGTIAAQGKFDWKRHIEWLFDVNAQNLNLQQIQQRYPATISLKTQISGNIREGLSVSAAIDNLSGSIAGYPLQGKGGIRYASDNIFLDRITVNAGTNTLSASGVLNRQSNLQFDLHADDLSLFHSDLAGRIQADGILRGNMQQPIVTVDLSGTAIEYAPYQLERIQLKGDVDLSPGGRLHVSLDAEGLDLDGQPIEKLVLQTDGNVSHHAIDVSLSSSFGNVNLKTTGSYSQKNHHWLATISTFQFTDTPAGDWRIKDIATVGVVDTADSIKIESSVLCFEQQVHRGELCMQAVWNESRAQLFDIHFDQLPLPLFNPWYPEDIQLNGLLRGKLQFNPTDLYGELMLSTDDGILHYRDDNQTVDYQYPFTTEVHATLKSDQLNTRFAFNTVQQSTMSGNISIDQVSTMQQAMSAGNVRINIPDLTFLNALQTEIADIGGALTTDFAFKGPLSNPYLTALNGSLNNVQLYLPDVGVKITGMQLNALKTAKQEFLLSGAAMLGDQQALLSGNIIHSLAEGSELRLTLQGEQLKIMQMPDIEVWASPDLQLLWHRRGMFIKGRVQVPKTVIMIAQLPETAVPVSNDEVIITDSTATAEQPQLIEVNADVDVVMGDQVSIDGFGIKAKLKGDLQAVYSKDRLQLFNELNLVDGVYQAYGQDLKIEKGQLLFSGIADNPNVNFLASRQSVGNGAKVTAYLQMTGTLKNPKTTIYTVPATSESEALSYLLTGKSLAKSGGSSSALLAKAAMYYGKDYVNGVMSVIGIEEFDFKSTSVGENSMVFGKRLTPDLYVSYIMDVLTSQMVLAVEYQLTEHISIETRAGDTHSSDIKYHMEFD